MGEKTKVRKWLVLPLATALMVLALPWPADTAFASEALDMSELAGSVEAAVPEETERGQTIVEDGEESLAVVTGEMEPGEGIDAESSEDESELEEARSEEVQPDGEPEATQTLDEDSPIAYAGNIIASGTDSNIKWTLDSDGLLNISGTGDFSSDPADASNLWGDYRDFITSAKVDVTGMTSAYGMFYGCGNLTSINLSGFDTSSVTNMANMFYGCSGLTNLDVSSFDTSNVIYMFGMFQDCASLESLDVSGFDTSNVTDMANMFYDCSGLTSLDVSGFDTSNVTNMEYMFYNCSGLTSLDVSGFDTGNVAHSEYTFGGMHGMFSGCSGLASLDVSGFDTSNVTKMSDMFLGCSSLTGLDVSGFNTGKVTRMDGMFMGCSSLTSLDLSGFDTVNVTNMKYIFSGCSGLESLDLSGFDTRSATEMTGMFLECSGLRSVDVSSFDTSNAIQMGGMFYGCSGLISLDLSKFDMSKVEMEYEVYDVSRELENMLGGCDKLETINAPLNLTLSVKTPAVDNTTWLLPDGTETTVLPLNLTESIKLCRVSAITVDAPTCEIFDYIGGKEVSFCSTTQDAVIYYSAKSEITDKDNRVENGGKVKFESFSGTLYARAYANGQWSDTIQITLNIPKAATPTITKSGNKVVIKAPTEGSIIYYTTDGSVPTLKNGKKAEGGSVTIDTLSGTVKAIAVKLGYANSAMARTVLLNSTKSRNVSFVVKGVFGGRNVTFNSETKGAKVYYSSTTSTLTTKDKCVNAGDTILFENFYGTIYARTYYNGEWGNVCRLILKIPVVNTPTVSVDNKGYATIRTTTPNSRIYYTTDGSTPSMKNGKMVSSPYVRVYVGKGKTVKAIAVRSCFTHSKVATGKAN